MQFFWLFPIQIFKYYDYFLLNYITDTCRMTVSYSTWS